MEAVEQNIEYDLAYGFIQYTNRSLFLTGKAGSGKTTLLKQIVKEKKKNAIVVAPTGVAAINAGGTTIHSFFQLPIGLYIPERSYTTPSNVLVNDKQTLLQNMRVFGNKRKLFEEIELLIIDEVSMVRADMIDAIDIVLRHYRKKMLVPFGGVQVLFIGDMFQLPPVARDQEWSILRQYYDTPYFFSAHAIKDDFPLMIELQKVYRQTDRGFISVLNRIRNNDLNEDDVEWLQSLYDSSFHPDSNDSYITLTTHNSKAEAINQKELEALDYPLAIKKGSLSNDFNENSLPVEMELKLKVGAQVMFVKNDTSPAREYYNGLIGTITKIDADEVEVETNEDKRLIVVKRFTWENVRYTYNEEEGKVDEERQGSYTQFPLRLAWAVTIHKSQGLTFDKAIIDAGSSFAPGQVYVALSRCRTKEGIILKSRITPDSIRTDSKVIEFSEKLDSLNELERILKQEKTVFIESQIKKHLSWDSLLDKVKFEVENAKTKKHSLKNESVEVMRIIVVEIMKLREVTDRFIEMQLNQLLEDYKSDLLSNRLKERLDAASIYIRKELKEKVYSPLNNHIDKVKEEKKTRKYIKELNTLKEIINRKGEELVQVGKLI